MLQNPLVKRALYFLLIGILLGVAISEVPFLFLRETARAPKQITLVIPKGTAEEVARGEQPPSIPKNMSFVVGDILIVKNEDSTTHKLGPLWIPANSSAQLPLEQQEQFVFECSFQPGKVLGIDVNESVTTTTRLYGMLDVGIPLGILLALYSTLIPIKKKEHVVA